jgi:hypothetical protein
VEVLVWGCLWFGRVRTRLHARTESAKTLDLTSKIRNQIFSVFSSRSHTHYLINHDQEVMTTTVAGWDGDPVLQVLHGRMMVCAMPWQPSVAQRRHALIAVASQHACVVQKPEILECQCEHPTIFNLSQPLPDKPLLTSPTHADLSLAGRSN